LLLQLLPFSQMPAPQLVVTAAVLAAAVPSAAALAKANRSTITTFEKTVVSPRRPFFYVRMKATPSKSKSGCISNNHEIQ
jgi:hypothetical protein